MTEAEKNYVTIKINSIIDWLTEPDGGHAVGEGNIKDAVSELLSLKQSIKETPQDQSQLKEKEVECQSVCRICEKKANTNFGLCISCQQDMKPIP